MKAPPPLHGVNADWYKRRGFVFPIRPIASISDGCRALATGTCDSVCRETIVRNYGREFLLLWHFRRHVDAGCELWISVIPGLERITNYNYSFEKEDFSCHPECTLGFVKRWIFIFYCVLHLSPRTKASARANISRSIRPQFLSSLPRILFLTRFYYKAAPAKNGLRSPLLSPWRHF